MRLLAWIVAAIALACWSQAAVAQGCGPWCQRCVDEVGIRRDYGGRPIWRGVDRTEFEICLARERERAGGGGRQCGPPCRSCAAQLGIRIDGSGRPLVGLADRDAFRACVGQRRRGPPGGNVRRGF
jgi:hypothetical protein